MMILTLLLSLPVGVSLGMLGGGGSILLVPLLVYVAGQPPREAVATSLLIVAITSATAAIPHARAEHVRWPTALRVGAGGAVGAVAGSRLATLVSDVVLLGAFGVIMLVAALGMLRGRGSGEAVSRADPPLTRALALGLGVGVVTGFLGAGGGFLLVPALALIGGLTVPAAIGTSLVVIVGNATVGFVSTVGSVSIDLPLVAGVTAVTVMGAMIGARLGARIEPARLRRGFGWFVIVVGSLVIAEQLPSAWLGQPLAWMGIVLLGGVVAMLASFSTSDPDPEVPS